jgi:transcription antitermination factor NusG
MNQDPWFIVRAIRIAQRQSFSEKPGPMDIWREGLGRLGCETYYPLIRELRRVPRQKLSRKRRASNFASMGSCVMPFLPGYLFVRGERADALQRIPCISDYVRTTGKKPARISDELIEKMRVREEEGAISGATPAGDIFTRGDRILVINGPFATFVGKVERAPRISLSNLPVPARLRLTMDVFGRATYADLPVNDVSKIQAVPGAFTSAQAGQSGRR